MRILCCVNRDLASGVALNCLLPALGAHEVRIGLTERVGGAFEAGEPPARRELRLAEQILANEVLFPLVERAALPDDGTRFLTFGEMERLRGIPVFPLPSPNRPEGLEVVRAFGPDLILTIRYGAILRPAFIALPPLGVLNLHSGLLPSYRGVLATFRALMNGDAEIGCTLHRIQDATIDTGEVLGRTRLAVRPDRSLLWHVLALYPAGTALIAAALAQLEAGVALEAIPQPTAGGAYFSYPTAVEWEEFARRGWRVADLGDLDEALRRFVPGGAWGGAETP
jgi:methionyl-tRNA formyltransferase